MGARIEIDMTAEEALEAYGFVRDADGLWKKSLGEIGFNTGTDMWLPVADGFLDFQPPRRGFGEIPYGWPVATLTIGTNPNVITGVEDGRAVMVEVGSAPEFPAALIGTVQVPRTNLPSFEGVSGLHPASHPEAFEWVWPAEKVAELYQLAPLGDKVIKIQDYDAAGVPAGYHYEEAPPPA